MRQITLNKYTVYERINIVTKWILKLADCGDISIVEFSANVVTGEVMIVSTWNNNRVIDRIKSRFKNPCIQPLSNGKTLIFHTLREQVTEDLIRLG